MRTAALLMVVCVAGGEVEAQSSSEARDGIAAGVAVGAGLEGAGAWLVTGARLSTPLGSRVALDVDAKHITGGSNRFSRIPRAYAGQVRIGRPRDANGVTRHWIVGLQWFDVTKFDGAGRRLGREHSSALVVGRGSDQIFANGLRVAEELTFSGGDGFLVLASVTVQFRLRR
jgi:hypothetical protein